jgi:thiol-disulfide isomerase/thioredoxin
MNMSPRNSWIRSAVSLALAAGLWTSAQAAPPKVGEAFPALAEFSLEGKLPELNGKVVVVDFWASWCGPCKEAFPTLKELQKKYGEKGLVIVAVSVDEDVDDMNKFVAKQKPEFTIVRDKTTKLATRLDLASIPTTYILDRSGKVAEVHNGFDRNQTPKEYQVAIERLLKD